MCANNGHVGVTEFPHAFQWGTYSVISVSSFIASLVRPTTLCGCLEDSAARTYTNMIPRLDRSLSISFQAWDDVFRSSFYRATFPYVYFLINSNSVQIVFPCLNKSWLRFHCFGIINSHRTVCFFLMTQKATRRSR